METESYKINPSLIASNAMCVCGHPFAAHGSNGRVCAACACLQFVSLDATSVGAALLDEIERASAKRQRLLDYQRNMELTEARGMAMAIAAMTRDITVGEIAVKSNDPASAIAALRRLRAFDNED